MKLFSAIWVFVFSVVSLAGECEIEKADHFSATDIKEDGEIVYSSWVAIDALHYLEDLLAQSVCRPPKDPPKCLIRESRAGSTILRSSDQTVLFRDSDREFSLRFYLHLVRLGQCAGSVPTYLPALKKTSIQERKNGWRIEKISGQYYRVGSYSAESTVVSENAVPQCVRARDKALARAFQECTSDGFSTSPPECFVSQSIAVAEGPVFYDRNPNLSSFCTVAVVFTGKKEIDESKVPLEDLR